VLDLSERCRRYESLIQALEDYLKEEAP